MATVIVTNRDVNEEARDETLFGDGFNARGPSELRIAKAEYTNARWELELLPEPETLTASTAPSRAAFEEMRRSLVERSRDCVFFVHGFNQTLATNLKKCKEIQDTYGVEVVAFSWPSQTGGQDIREYDTARAAARLSINALDRTLHKVALYMGDHLLPDCGVSFNLLVHSTGVAMLEELVRIPLFSRPIRIFDNVLLHQGDVHNARHAEWVDRIRLGKRLYVTINERDHVLKWADVNTESDRLGNTCRNLDSTRAKYVDFTKADLVGTSHRIYWKSRHNPHVRAFFRRVLHGERAEIGDGMIFNPEANAYAVA